jgi:hypothetical protein
MPTFSCADQPQDHPLLVRDRASDPVMRSELIGKLAHFAMMRLQMPEGPLEAASATRIITRRPGPQARTTIEDSSVANAAVPTNVVPAPQTSHPASDEAVHPGQISSAEQPGALHVAQLAAAIASLGGAVTSLREEIAQLRTSSAVRASNTSSLEKRLSSLAGLLERQFSERRSDHAGRELVEEISDRADPERLSLVEVVRQSGASHSDALLVLENAERSAQNSPYEDVDRAAVILDAMADVARRRQNGTLQNSLRDAFREIGLEYRGGIASSTSEKLRRQYVIMDSNGRVFDCHEHIAVGSTYDPRHCLRIYFTSRATVESRFVIGHVGRHFDVESTT